MLPAGRGSRSLSHMTCRRSTNEITIILSPGRAAGRRQSLPGRLGICGCQTEEALKFVISEKRVLREVEKMNATEIYLVSILEPALPCGLYPLKRHPIKSVSILAMSTFNRLALLVLLSVT